MYQVKCVYDTDSGDSIEFGSEFAHIHGAMGYCDGIAMMLIADVIDWTDLPDGTMTADHGRVRFTILNYVEVDDDDE